MGQFSTPSGRAYVPIFPAAADAIAVPPTGWTWVNSAAATSAIAGGVWTIAHGATSTRLDNGAWTGPAAYRVVQTGQIGVGGFRATARLKGNPDVSYNHVLFALTKDTSTPAGPDINYIGIYYNFGGSGGYELGSRVNAALVQVASSAAQHAAGVWVEFRGSHRLNGISLWYSLANTSTRPTTGWTFLTDVAMLQSAAFRLWFGIATDTDVSGTLQGSLSGLELVGAP